MQAQQRLFVWLKRTAVYMLRPDLSTWGALLATAAIFLIAASLASGGEQLLRLAGVLLQLLGLSAIAYGLIDKSTEFKLRGFVGGLFAGLRLPAWPRTHDLTANSLATGAAVATSVSIRTNVQRGDLTERVTELERRYADLRQEYDKFVGTAMGRISDLQALFDGEKAERLAAETAADRKLQRVLADNIRLEATGLVWLVLGVILGTVPQDLIQLWSWAISSK